MLKRIRKLPLFPVVPFVPLALLGGVIGLEVFLLAKLRKLSDQVESLAQAQALAAPIA